jgi:hypothetical protein
VSCVFLVLCVGVGAPVGLVGKGRRRQGQGLGEVPVERVMVQVSLCCRRLQGNLLPVREVQALALRRRCSSLGSFEHLCQVPFPEILTSLTWGRGSALTFLKPHPSQAIQMCNCSWGFGSVEVCVCVCMYVQLCMSLVPLVCTVPSSPCWGPPSS